MMSRCFFLSDRAGERTHCLHERTFDGERASRSVHRRVYMARTSEGIHRRVYMTYTGGIHRSSPGVGCAHRAGCAAGLPIRSHSSLTWQKILTLDEGLAIIKLGFGSAETEGAMSYIERAITPILRKRVSESKCLLMTGARQVGKSTLIKHAFPEYHRANFDDRLTRLQAREEPGLFFLNNPCPLFIDEVQKEKNILEDIKLRVDDTDERGQFILSGSQNLELMKGMSESLAGRVSITELDGLSMREIEGVDFNRHFVPTAEYLAEREKTVKPYRDLWERIHKGFYPELYDTERDWQDYYSSYVATYLERDINDLIAADSITFTKFLISVAARTGEMLNYTNIASEVGVSEPTVKTWVSILERTGIVYILPPYSSGALHRAIRTPKIYFRDTGLACYLTRWLTADTLKNSAVAGNMFETFVISEILKSYSNEGMDYRFNVYYYRGKDRRAASDDEIDLVIDENGILYPVEIKMSANPKAAMGAANQLLDKIPEKKRGMGIILCLIEKKLFLRENLLALPITYI